ncbi:hypothetical protein [Cerasicoccus frondis]|uniref:hypothetical protein n=1 Tax=Cerasicoccus frondis TaxID=490090 RepID=UPI00285260E5|nr:hypothetical protein [Cerasicoccus frondis]
MNWKSCILALAFCSLTLPAMGQLLKIHVEVWQDDILDESNSRRIAGPTIVTKSGESATFTMGQEAIEGEADLQHGTIFTAKVTETNGQCAYRCLLVVRGLKYKDAASTDACLAFATQEFLLRGEMPLGDRKEYQLDEGRRLSLSIEPQDPIVFKPKQ